MISVGKYFDRWKDVSCVQTYFYMTRERDINKTALKKLEIYNNVFYKKLLKAMRGMGISVGPRWYEFK